MTNNNCYSLGTYEKLGAFDNSRHTVSETNAVQDSESRFCVMMNVNPQRHQRLDHVNKTIGKY